MSAKKWIVTGAALLLSVGLWQNKFKKGEGFTSIIPNDLVENQSSDATEENLFGGLTESQINSIVSGIDRGVRAFIEKGILVFKFKSSSNKQTLEATYEMVSDKVVNTFVSGPYGNTPNAPKFFQEMLVEAIDKKNHQKDRPGIK